VRYWITGTSVAAIIFVAFMLLLVRGSSLLERRQKEEGKHRRADNTSLKDPNSSFFFNIPIEINSAMPEDQILIKSDTDSVLITNIGESTE